MQITFEGVHGNDEVYMDCLRAICGGTQGKSMADLCCNLAPHTPKLGFKHTVYVDIISRKLDHEAEQPFFVNADIFEYLKTVSNPPKYAFDTIILSDAIEHIYKPKGFELLDLIFFASARQVLFTPLGEYMVDDTDNPEGHHSGWTPEDFNGKNFAFIVFPNYHPTLSIGAFFAWHCDTGMKKDFERVKNELKEKSWAK